MIGRTSRVCCSLPRSNDSRCESSKSVGLLLKGRFFVPQGTPLPLKSEETYQKIPENSMFMFARNVASPYCKSTYSTSGGQLCLGMNQIKYVGERRAGNNDFPGDGT